MSSRFSNSLETLQQITLDILRQAKDLGATECEAEVSEGFGQTVTVRRGEVETIEYNRDKGVGVTVFKGKQRGHASTSDFSKEALEDTVKAAWSIAQFTAIDEFAGLADPELLAKKGVDLDLHHPWDLPIEKAIALTTEMESAAFKADKRITNSEGATASTQESHFVYGNSSGFLDGYLSSRHEISCTMIAESAGGMQRDYWYSTARDPADLENAIKVGERAASRTVRRLNARKINTQDVPVLYEAGVASGLIGHMVSAISGGNLYRKSSFLLDSLEKKIFSSIIQIQELPLLKKALASAAFDNEGVATKTRDLVTDGVLHGYFLGSYAARKLGMQTTGNAGGNYNLIVQSGGKDFAGLLKEMGRGLVVTELLGQGINPVTGDYSRGAAGFWVENGEIQYAVEEVTIAGNLRDMYQQIVAVGNDVLVRGSKQCGSILIEQMTVAGN